MSDRTRYYRFGPRAIAVAKFLRDENLVPDEGTIGVLAEIHHRFPDLSARDLYGAAVLAAALALEAQGHA
jgi:hypothetical protein